MKVPATRLRPSHEAWPRQDQVWARPLQVDRGRLPPGNFVPSSTLKLTLTMPYCLCPSQTLVCLHMSPRSMDEYADVRGLWAGKYRVIAIDFLGLGAPRTLSILNETHHHSQAIHTLRLFLIPCISLFHRAGTEREDNLSVYFYFYFISFYARCL